MNNPKMYSGLSTSNVDKNAIKALQEDPDSFSYLTRKEERQVTYSNAERRRSLWSALRSSYPKARTCGWIALDDLKAQLKNPGIPANRSLRSDIQVDILIKDLQDHNLIKVFDNSQSVRILGMLGKENTWMYNDNRRKKNYRPNGCWYWILLACVIFIAWSIASSSIFRIIS